MSFVYSVMDLLCLACRLPVRQSGSLDTMPGKFWASTNLPRHPKGMPERSKDLSMRSRFCHITLQSHQLCHTNPPTLLRHASLLTNGKTGGSSVSQSLILLLLKQFTQTALPPAHEHRDSFQASITHWCSGCQVGSPRALPASTLLPLWDNRRADVQEPLFKLALKLARAKDS